VSNSSWMAQASCTSVGPDIFFDENQRSYARARKVCAQCPVLEKCRDFIDGHESRWKGAFGFFAGETPRERNLRRRRRAS
jgi:hypothetical protein